MSLIEEALADNRQRGPECDVTRALNAHPKMADDIAALIRAAHVQASAAARTLERHGVHITQATIRRHRAGDCATCKQAGRAW